MPADPNWARYIFASVATYLKAFADDHSLPVVIEGLHERTDAYMESADRIEVRINGPYTQEISKNYYRVWVDANVLLTSRMESGKNAFSIQRFAGVFQSAMDGPIPLWNYGDQPGDYLDSDITTQKWFGCLSPRSRANDSIKVYHFGQVEKTDHVKQTIVDASYFVFLEPGVYLPGISFPVFPPSDASTANPSAEADSSIVAGMPLYVKGNSHVDIAGANSAATCGVIGIADESAAPTFAVSYSPDGHIVLNDWTPVTGSPQLVPGAIYYLDTTPGFITATAPTAGFLVVIGRAATATRLDIELGTPIRL